MSELRGVVVGHGGLAAALIDAVARIAGSENGLVAVSNTDCDRGALEKRITDAVGEGPAIVFIDMPSGSCMFAAMHRLREMPGMRLVTGVNLAMLLEFVFHRDGDLDDVASKVADAGASAIGMR
jgi:mannose/fructose-specific phosphotransferase system component IIA